MGSRLNRLPTMSNLPRYSEAVVALGGIETAISMVPAFVSPETIMQKLEIALSFIVRTQCLIF